MRNSAEETDVGRKIEGERGRKTGTADIQRWSYLTFTFTSYHRPRSPQQVLKIVEAAD